MEAETVQEVATSQELKARLTEAQQNLDDLARDLSAVDAELDALSPERQQHRTLQTICDGLDDLAKLGGTALFWGGSAAPEAIDSQMRRMRGNLAAFEARVCEIEGRRHGVIDLLKEQQNLAWVLEDDAFEAQEEEERRRNEWLVERETDALRHRTPMMPWSRGGEDDKRFRKSLGTALLISVLFAVVVAIIKLPISALQDEPVKVPERVVSMMMEKHQPPPPPAEMKLRPPERVVEQKPVEKPVQQQVAKPQPQQDVPGPEQGLLAFREKLESFKEVPVANLGAQARIRSEDSAARPERSMLTTSAPGSSGGIKLAALSRSFGANGGNERGAIQGAALTKASSRINSIAPAGHPLSNGPGPSRTDEEIQIVFDRYKSSLYRLYNKELRRDPSLQGKIILRLTIEPDGTVSLCQMQSTDMNAPDLAAQVVDRVRTFNFGAKEVPAITIVYPIDFLPAA